jgi:hypothetical protein
VVASIAAAREHLRKAPGVAQRVRGTRVKEKRVQQKIVPFGAA